ncbi:MAG: hypothetical protein AAGF91_01245, partial [Actinomycetota bacterium]
MNWYEPGASGIVPAGGRFIMITSRYGLADARDAGWQVCGPTVPVPWWAVSQYLAAMFSRRPNDGWFRVGRY